MTQDDLLSRGIVAEFHKSARGRLTLFSLTAIETKRGASDGREYRCRTYYDVAHSRRYGYIFHESGGGGGAGAIEVSGIYFISGDVKVKEKPCQLVDWRDRPPWRGKKTRATRERNKTRRLPALSRVFKLEPGWDLLDWLQHNGIEQESVYCSICRDEMPVEEHCRHVFENEHGEWLGAGQGAEAGAEETKASLFQLFERMPDGFAADLRVAIASGKFHTWFVAPQW